MKDKRSFLRGIFCSVLIGLFLGVQNANALDPSDQKITLTCPYWTATVDAAGYGDLFYWGNSPYHPHSSHELLSGEWAAAIYYDGIATDSNAMWLTNWFEEPDWPTLNDFEIYTNPTRSNNASNPVNGYDTGNAVIRNSEVEVTIDYEVVDVNEVGWWSPLAYQEPNDVDVSIAKSERYLFLQTYIIKNIKASGNVTGLEFYQMLHLSIEEDGKDSSKCFLWKNCHRKF